MSSVPLLLLTALSFTEPLEPGDHLRKLDVDGRPRSYLVHIPPGYEPSRPTPVVLAFHGSTMNARMMATYSGLSKKADEAGFVVAYPNGFGHNKLTLLFNPGGLPEQGGKTRPDDVAFTSRLLDDLETVITVDRRRVFATGLSMGGMMCYRLAAELSERIAAIAPVAGPIAIAHFRPRRPVPIIHFHGTADSIVAWNGPDEATASIFSFMPVDESIRLSALANHCDPEPVTEELPNLEDDGTTVTRETYQPRPDGADVILYKINGGGHTWPGHNSFDRLLGPSTRDISANDLMWEFFQQHPLPEMPPGSFVVRTTGPRTPLPFHVTRRVVQDYRFVSRRAFLSDTRQFPALRSKGPDAAADSR